MSVVLYAVAAPDEWLEDSNPPSKGSEWGNLRVADPQPSSPSDQVRISGSSPAIGGEYTIRMKPPSVGSFSPQIVQPSGTENTDEEALFSGSRSLLRNRNQRPQPLSDDFKSFQISARNADVRAAWSIETLLRNEMKKSVTIPGTKKNVRLLNPRIDKDASTVLVQRLAQAPFEFEVSLVVSEGLSPTEVDEIENDLSGNRLEQRLERLRDDFDRKFERTFGLTKKGIPTPIVQFGKEALSNVLGGIGYFYGSSLTKKQGSSDDNVAILPEVGLLTATPSRVVFPRGFLWDEGFHQIIVQRWDPQLSIRCLSSWFAASQASGWIPREQILGLEARNRFPEHVRHLIIQDSVVANPPTILLPMLWLWSSMKEGRSEKPSTPDNDISSKLANDLLTRIATYYEWLKYTQAGERANSFRWRGRSHEHKSPNGYPLTLSSGLDDFPRAQSVSEGERHVDLHSWITWSSRLLAQILEVHGQDGSRYWEEYERLRSALVDHHGQTSPKSGQREDLLLCDYDGEERICHEGYPTLLPLALGLLDVDDPRVSTILDSLEDSTLLRSVAGVCSLSKSDKWHRQGDDYWTGSVWMPFNYLVLAALKTKYTSKDGPYRERALKLYEGLRQTIVDNTLRVYAETGMLWENYAPDDGSGKSGRQFTGWTSLILLIIAEMFDDIA